MGRGRSHVRASAHRPVSQPPGTAPSSTPPTAERPDASHSHACWVLTAPRGTPPSPPCLQMGQRSRASEVGPPNSQDFSGAERSWGARPPGLRTRVSATGAPARAPVCDLPERAGHALWVWFVHLFLQRTLMSGTQPPDRRQEDRVAPAPLRAEGGGHRAVQSPRPREPGQPRKCSVRLPPVFPAWPLRRVRFIATVSGRCHKRWGKY